MSNIPDNNLPKPESRARAEAESTTRAEPPRAGDSFDEEPPERCFGPLQVPVSWSKELTPSLPDKIIQRAVGAALGHRGFFSGEIGIYVTTDDEIQVINAKHLGHDYATDVISFPYDANAPVIHGELVVSIDTAKKCATRAGWPTESELILYIVHGVLHITGMDDQSDDERAQMRDAEREVLTEIGMAEVDRFGAHRYLASGEDIESGADVKGDRDGGNASCNEVSQ